MRRVPSSKRSATRFGSFSDPRNRGPAAGEVELDEDMQMIFRMNNATIYPSSCALTLAGIGGLLAAISAPNAPVPSQ